MSDYKVKTTKNFNMFQISENNRQVDEKHVQKFVKEFEKNGYLVAFPVVAVITRGKYQIIDGQHRFLAAQKVGCEFSFIEIDIIDEADWLEKLQKVNKLSKKWSVLDYLRMSTDESIKDILPIIDENPENLSFITHYCRIQSEKNMHKTNIKKEELVLSVDILKKLQKYTKTKQVTMIGAIKILIREKLDINRLIRNIEKQPMKFVNCATRPQFTQMIEYFYNYDYPKASRIKFDI